MEQNVCFKSVPISIYYNSSIILDGYRGIIVQYPCIKWFFLYIFIVMLYMFSTQ